MTDEPVSETIAKLRAGDSEYAHIVADKLEEASVGIGLWSFLYDVHPDEITYAMSKYPPVRKEFTRMVGGVDHAFGYTLGVYFEHVEVFETQGDWDFEVNERGYWSRLKGRYRKWRA